MRHICIGDEKNRVILRSDERIAKMDEVINLILQREEIQALKEIRVLLGGDVTERQSTLEPAKLVHDFLLLCMDESDH